MRSVWPFVVGGVVLSAVGALWTLQGLDVIGGSVMSGSSVWAVIGPLVLVAGLALVGVGIANARRRRSTR